MINKNKFKKGLKKILGAITIGFIGPVLFMFNTSTFIMLFGFLFMIGAVILGFLGVKDLVDSFFEKKKKTYQNSDIN